MAAAAKKVGEGAGLGKGRENFHTPTPLSETRVTEKKKKKFSSLGTKILRQYFFYLKLFFLFFQDELKIDDDEFDDLQVRKMFCTYMLHSRSSFALFPAELVPAVRPRQGWHPQLQGVREAAAVPGIQTGR